MSKRRNFTEASVRALEPAAARYELMDQKVQGLLVRVNPTGHKAWMLYARFLGPKSMPSPCAIGACNKLTVQQARDIAHDWHAQIRKGLDPRAELKRQKREAEAKRADTFGAVAETFIRVKLPDRRRRVKDEAAATW